MRHIPYTLLVLAATAGFASAQATAYTTPVGYVTETFPPTSDKSFAVGLERAAFLQTTATGASGADVTIKASGLTANQLQFSAGVQENTYYARFLDGALEGQYFAISGNQVSNDNGTPTNPSDDTTVITLETAVTITGTPAVKIVPYWTLGTLFPGGEGVGVSTSLNAEPVGFFVLTNQVDTGINRSPSKVYFYSDGTFTDTSEAGFYDFDDVFAGKVDNLITINPEDMFLIRNNSATEKTLVVEGTVPNSAAATTFIALASEQNDNYVAQPFPIDISLYDSGLHVVSAPTTSAVRNSPTASSPLDFAVTYSSTPASQNESPAKVYFYQDGTDSETPTPGWYDNDDYFSGIIPTTEKTLVAGQGFIIRKGPLAPSGGGGLWKAPLPYTLP